VHLKKNKTKKVFVYKGVSGCKGVLKSGLYIYNKMRQVFGGIGGQGFQKIGPCSIYYIFFRLVIIKDYQT